MLLQIRATPPRRQAPPALRSGASLASHPRFSNGRPALRSGDQLSDTGKLQFSRPLSHRDWIAALLVDNYSLSSVLIDTHPEHLWAKGRSARVADIVRETCRQKQEDSISTSDKNLPRTFDSTRAMQHRNSRTMR